MIFSDGTCATLHLLGSSIGTEEPVSLAEKGRSGLKRHPDVVRRTTDVMSTFKFLTKIFSSNDLINTKRCLRELSEINKL